MVLAWDFMLKLSVTIPLNKASAMYFASTTPVPNLPGKIVFKKKNAVCYVLFEVERIYDPKRRFNIPKRVCIGKLAPQAGSSSLMIPNEKFQVYFPDTPVLPLTPAGMRSNTIKIGSYVAFSTIVAEYGLSKLLKSAFGDKAGLILDLAAYLIVTEDNAAQYYPDYARHHPLFTEKMVVVSDSTISRLLSNVTRDQITAFLDGWNRQQDHRQRIYISYDSTNKNFQAGDVDFVEFGHPKVDQGFPIFNVSLAFDKTNRIPLFYEEYPGSIPDVNQLTYLVEKIYVYGYRSMGIILDRGYFSKANLDFMDSKHFHFLIMVKGCKKLVSSFILDNLHTFEAKRAHRIEGVNLYGITIIRELQKGDGKPRYFHLFFSPMKMASERADVEKDIERMTLELKKLEGQECEIGRPYTDFFTIHYAKTNDGKKKFLFAEENPAAIERRLNLCGYFCLLSSEKLSAAEAYHLYRGRDVSEKLFRADKSFLGSKSQRVHSNEAVSTKLFIEFLALIIRNRFYNLLKDEMLRLKVRRNYMTVPAAIRELEKIEMTRRNGTRYLMDFALTKNQKLILQCFGLSSEEVTTRAQAIATLLDAAPDQSETNEETTHA